MKASICYSIFCIGDFLHKTPHDLTRRIDRIYDHLYASATQKTPQSIGVEIGKVLHVGMYREKAFDAQFGFGSRFDAKPSFITSNLAGMRTLAKPIRSDFKTMNAAWGIYDSKAVINLSDFDLVFVTAELNGIQIADPNRDIFGDALEIVRAQWAKRTGGQFFTDQQVTRLAMKLLEFDPTKGQDLVDICAGTGGFLLAGLSHIKEALESAGNYSEQKLVELAREHLKGQEIDPLVSEVANATLSARLGGFANPIVTTGDSLNGLQFQAGSSRIQASSHYCVASNPPFGSKTTVKDPTILRQYELAKVAVDGLELVPGSHRCVPRSPDALFLEQNVSLLIPGEGRLAIVLPYQHLSGPQALFIRKWLLQETVLEAVIDLPSETFQPHTGTKTALVVLRRRSTKADDKNVDHKVFMSTPRWIGHDRRGHPVFRRSPDGTLTEEILTDFNEVSEAYQEFRRTGSINSGSELCFVTDLRAVRKDPLLRINALFHKPTHQLHEKLLKQTTEWRKVQIKDVVKEIFFPTRFKRHYVDFSDGAIPFIGGSNISQLNAVAEKWLRADHPGLDRLKVKTGWILITRSGSTGIVSSVPPAWDGFAMSEHIIRIVPDETRIDPHYLKCFLSTALGQSILARGVFGSVIDEITPEYIGDITLLVPKSKKTLDAIVASMQRAEAGRAEAMKEQAAAIEKLNQQFENQFFPKTDLKVLTTV